MNAESKIFYIDVDKMRTQWTRRLSSGTEVIFIFAVDGKRISKLFDAVDHNNGD